MRTIEIQPKLRFGWPWRHWLLFAVVCCALVVISAVATPVINQYRQLAHIEDQLAQALELEGRLASGDLWHDLTPLTNPMAIAIAQQALAEAERLVAGNPTNVIILQQWGRLAMLAGQPETAITAFSAATAYQPDSPLLWWQLGMAYERLAAPIGLDATAEPTLEWVTPPPSARVWSLWPAMLGQPTWWAPAEPIRRPLALADRLELRATLPATTTNLIFWPVRLTAEPTTYQVLVNNQPVTLNLSTVTGVGAGWQPALIDLSPWAGQTVALTLVSDQPMGWGEVQLVTAADTRCALVMCRQRAAAAWKEGGFTFTDFLRAGETIYRLRRYTEALVWYQRALLFNRQRSDIWYYVGRVLEGDTQWERALAAYTNAITVNEWSTVSKSKTYFQIGEIYQRQLVPPQYEAALTAYQTALSLNDFPTDVDRAQCYYRIGETLWWREAIDQAILHLETAIALNPLHDWAYIRLGTAYFARDNDVPKAERLFFHAIEISPRNKWAYYFLGEMYQKAGLTKLSEEAYKKVLEIDPQFAPAQERLQQLIR